MQAAALAHGISETQPFIEGNKRAALAAMLTFMRVNGYEVTASQGELAGWIIRLSEGLAPRDLAERIRSELVATRSE
jgi:death-on-curing protein